MGMEAVRTFGSVLAVVVVGFLCVALLSGGFSVHFEADANGIKWASTRVKLGDGLWRTRD
jgi:hypothetical protein